MSDAVLVEGLRMRYGPREVLHDVSFRVAAGEVVALLGPNGAGKTTTIEILEGFRVRTGGRVEVLGADPATGGEQWRARVGVVLQSWRDHGKWRAGELLTQIRAYYLPYRQPWDVGDLLATVGLAEAAGREVRTLSGGQRRRLDVAIGLVGRPDLLFLDEPTTGFDPEARRDFHDLIAGLGTTIVLTTHDLDEAARLADRILILDRGGIVAAGTPDSLAGAVRAEREVHWRVAAETHVRSTAHAARLVAELYRIHGDAIEDLVVRRPGLEDAYLATVQR